MLPALCSATVLARTGSGVPLAGVVVAVDGRRGGTTDGRGRLALPMPCGVHALDATHEGYRGAGSVRIDLRAQGTIVVVLPALGDPLGTIARVTVDGRLALPRSTVPQETLAVEDARAQGDERVVDTLARVASLTLVRPAAGGRGAVAVAASRGPDPSETTISLDGQVLNDTNTGDFDLSQLPLVAFSRLSVTEGIGPETSAAANTIGGDIDLQTLAPTTTPQAAFALRAGAFGANELGASATGTADRIGYAFALDDAQRDGVVREFAATFSRPGERAATVPLGAASSARTLLAKLVYTSPGGTTLGVRAFALANRRDQSAALDAPEDSGGDVPGGAFVGPGAATSTQNLDAYAFDGATPLGGGTLAANYALSASDVTYLGGASASPYAVSHQDDLATFSLGFERRAGILSLDAGGYARAERLAESTAFDVPQRERSLAAHLRAELVPVPRLRLTGALFTTKYSTFGTSLDGRAGASFDLDARSVVRASIGTGFRAPLLTERYAAPLAALAGTVDANCVAANGNPSLQPEHVTAYEAGVGRRIGEALTVDATLYRTNLRGPIEIAYPLGAACSATGGVAGEAIPINVGRAVYTGGTLRVAARLSRATFARLEYGLNAAYPLDLPATVANPTSGANLVAGQQFQGIPLQSGSATFAYAPGRFHAAAGIVTKGIRNELNQGPYAYASAAVGYGDAHADLTLSATNLTNAVAGRFTRLHAGVPYPTPAGPLPTDAYVLEPFALAGTLTLRL